MFRSTQILERARQRPFRPFRILTSAGQGDEIRQPEFITIGERTIYVFKPGAHGPGMASELASGPERVTRVHIVALEELPPVDASDQEVTEEA